MGNKTISFIQEKFNEYFIELLNNTIIKYFDEDLLKVCYPTTRIGLYDTNNELLFDIRTGEHAHFWYSRSKILPLFREKFGVDYKELRKLMQPMLNKIFNLYDVTPKCKRYFISFNFW